MYVKCEERENSGKIQSREGWPPAESRPAGIPLGSPWSGLWEQDGRLRRYRSASARPMARMRVVPRKPGLSSRM